MIRVFIADDHSILRRGLKEILERELEGVACGEAENAQQIVAQVQSHTWDLVILDISRPGRRGADRRTEAGKSASMLRKLSCHYGLVLTTSSCRI
jgi:DNA-binding NarL/FixJ family response regulator